jgi:hypothetical protein
MTFSLRLTADLGLALAARAFSNKLDSSPILRLSPENNFDSASTSSAASSPESKDSTFQSVARVSRFRTPIIWVGGAEPLDHPQTARFANALAASGRNVFLETSGASLKRRLHEFQPSARFYFAVRFGQLHPPYSNRTSSEGALRVGLEALRMARLAGFLTCAHLVLPLDAAAAQVEPLHAEIQRLDVDGCLITCGDLAPELQKSADQLRGRLLSRRWALLSRLLDTSASPAKVIAPLEIGQLPLPESQPESFGEGAEAG